MRTSLRVRRTAEISRLAAVRKEIHVLLAGWEVRVVRNCDRGLENAVGK